jgi:hypothetical protein
MQQKVIVIIVGGISPLIEPIIYQGILVFPNVNVLSHGQVIVFKSEESRHLTTKNG